MSVLLARSFCPRRRNRAPLPAWLSRAMGHAFKPIEQRMIGVSGTAKRSAVETARMPWSRTRRSLDPKYFPLDRLGQSAQTPSPTGEAMGGKSFFVGRRSEFPRCHRAFITPCPMARDSHAGIAINSFRIFCAGDPLSRRWDGRGLAGIRNRRADRRPVLCTRHPAFPVYSCASEPVNGEGCIAGQGQSLRDRVRCGDDSPSGRNGG